MGKINLIIQREYSQRVRKRSFIMVTLLMPLLLLAIPGVVVLANKYGSGTGPAREIVVVDPAEVIAPALSDTDRFSFTSTSLSYADALQNPEFEGTFGFLVIPPDILENSSAPELYTRETTTMDQEAALRRQIGEIVRQRRIEKAGIPALDSLMQRVNALPSLSAYRIDVPDEERISASVSKTNAGAAYLMGIIIYMFIFIYGQQVMQSVIEEKSNRIVEVIISSVRPYELMMGKIIGLTLVALTQFIVWIVMAVVATGLVGQLGGIGLAGIGALAGDLNTGELLTMAGWFLVFFTGGYLLYASLYAALGSGAESPQDASQLQWPVAVPLIVAFMLMMSVIRDPTTPAAFWFSIFPLTSPMIMLARIPHGVPAWEMALSVGLLYATFAVTVVLAARIYRNGIFMYGRKASFAEMLRWIKSKE